MWMRLATGKEAFPNLERVAMLRRATFPVLSLFASLALAALLAAGAAQAACAPQSFDRATFTVCAFHPKHDDIRLFWKDPDDHPFRSLGAVSAAVRAKGQELVFAMNAGMFAEDLSPIGLYVEGGGSCMRRTRRAARATSA